MKKRKKTSEEIEESPPTEKYEEPSKNKKRKLQKKRKQNEQDEPIIPLEGEGEKQEPEMQDDEIFLDQDSQNEIDLQKESFDCSPQSKGVIEDN